MKVAKNSGTAEAATIKPYIIEGMQDKKAPDIAILNLTNVPHAIADYFVICTGNSNKHLDAIADAVEEKVRKGTGSKPESREGNDEQGWLLLDYIDIVVHIFLEEKRDYYTLEELWGDAEITWLENIE